MATELTISSNYEGVDAGKRFGEAFKDADTLRLGLLTVAENVNYKYNLRRIRYSDGTTDYTCGFTPQGAVTLSEKVIEPKKLMNSLQICKEDFRQTWNESSMGASAVNNNIPSDEAEAIEMEILSSQAEKIDTDIWTGIEATDGEFGGYIEQFTADGNIIKDGNGITAPGHSVLESTVQADIKLALAAVPIPLRRKDLVVAVSPDVFQAYNFKMISLGQANDGTSEEKQAKFGRYTLTEVNGLPDNTIIVYEKKNMVFATGLQGDFNELRIQDEDEISLMTGLVRAKMVYNAGVGYYNSEDIVWLLLTD